MNLLLFILVLLKFTLVFEYFQKNYKTPCSIRIDYGETAQESNLK